MSDNILKEICNKVLSLFRQSESKENSAKSVACNRLRVVLMQDRTSLTPETLQRMRRELVELLSKYVEMDKDALDLNFDQEDGQMALMLSIPVIRAKNEEEIWANTEDVRKKALEKGDELDNVDFSEIIEDNENETNDENNPQEEVVEEEDFTKKEENEDEEIVISEPDDSEISFESKE